MPYSSTEPIHIQKIQDISLHRFGIIVSEKRAERLLSNPFRQWSTRHKTHLTELLERVKTEPEENVLVKEFVSMVTIGESYFFRHREQLEALVSWVQAHVSHPVRIWSAACSHGSEVYSLAYLLKEKGIDYHILGTDIDTNRLQTASNLGPYDRYTIRSNDSSPKELMALVQNQYWIHPSWSNNIQFQYHNLHSSQVPKPPIAIQGRYEWDIIICRNAFIYFSTEQTRSVLRKMSKTLSQTGTVWLSVNDALFNTTEILHPHRWDGVTYLSKELAPLTFRIKRTGSHPVKQLLQKNTKSETKISPTVTKAQLDEYHTIAPESTSFALLRRCLENGYPNIAKDMVQTQLRAMPNHFGLNLTLCAMYFREHQFDLAWSVLRNVPKSEISRAEYSYFEALLHYAQHQHDRAKLLFHSVIHAEPSHWAARAYLGTINLKERQWLNAEVQFEEAKELLENQTLLNFEALYLPKGFHEDPDTCLEYVCTQLLGLG